LRKNGFIYCLIVLLLIPFFGFSQEPVKTEERDIFFYINYVLREKDTSIIFLNGAEGKGILKGDLVTAYRTFRKSMNPGEKDREFGVVGSGRVVKADSLTGCLIKLLKINDTLAVGDLVSLRVKAPKLKYRSIFSDLAFNKLVFTDFDKNGFYALADVWNDDGEKKEDSLFNIMLNDLHNTYQQVKDRTNLPSVLTNKINGGRYSGKTSLELIRDATKDDLKSFLLYVNAYPFGYRARNYRLSESFAGWAVFGGPYSPREVKEALLPVYTNTPVFSKLLPAYRKDILNDQYCLSYSKEIEQLIAEEKYAEARHLSGFVKVLSYAVNDTSGKSLGWLYEAEIDQKQDRYDLAVQKCDSAIKYAIMAAQYEYELAAISKKIFCYNTLMQFANSKKELQEMEKKLAKYKPLISEAVYNSNLQKRYEYEGAMHYAEGNYDQALSTYAKLISINKGINSYDALMRNADYFTFIGRVNNEQGKPANARDSLLLAARIYRSNNDTLNWGRVQNHIALSYYKLGSYRQSIAYCDSAMDKLMRMRDLDNAGYSRSLTGSCYWELGNYDSAVIAHKSSIALRRMVKTYSPGQARSWKSIGDLYLLSGLKTQALGAFDTAAYYYEQIKDSSGLAETYNKKGSVYLNDESYKKAAAFFEIAKGVNNKSTVEALFNLGNAWEAIDTVKANRYYSGSRQLSQQTGNTYYQFFATKSLATLAYRSNKINEGDRLYRECLSLGAQLNTPTASGHCNALRAYRFYTQTKLDSALWYYARALEIFDTTDRSEYIWQLNNMADIYVSTGEFKKADECLNKAISLARAASNTLALGYSLQATTFLYGLTAEFTKGISNNDSAMSIFMQSGNMVRLANTHASRGSLLSNMGNYRQSINAYLFADSIYADELLTESRGIVFNNIGNTYLGQLDFPNALNYFRRALNLLPRGVVNESYLLVQGNIAECLAGLNKKEESKKLLLEIIPQARTLNLNRIASGMALVMGKIWLEENNTGEALSYFNYARDFATASGEQDKLIEALVNIGKISLLRGMKDSAAASLRRAVTLVNTYRTGNGWRPAYELGLLFYNNRQFDSAIIYFKQSVEALEKNAENLYGGDEARKLFNNDPGKSDLYNKITFALYNTGNLKDAWSYANRSNIAGIKELSGALSTSSTDEAKNEALKKLLAMQQSKKALENTVVKQEGPEKEETIKKIEILEADYNNFLQDVVAQYPELSTYFSRSNADEFNSYKSKLDNDVAVLLYLLNNNTLMIFSLTREKLSVDTMTIDLGSKVKSFISAIKNTDQSTGTGALAVRSEPVDEEKPGEKAEFKDLSGELYRVLVSTVADKISGKKKLCIIPTGVFSNMPFQCLGRKTADNGFRFLIEDFGIFYTNKMAIFNTGRTEPEKNMASFAAFGVPDEKLQFNIAEVKEIGKILGSDSTVYADGRATESMAKQSLRQKKFIHFATHGVLNYSSDYSQSYLKLLPDKDTSGGNNGQLTMREIQRLGITDCNMVILSACQTAVSAELVKGWSISPANSFLVSNVKTVVASLWKVADEPTGLLMQYFYENLSKPVQMEKEEALRQAQIRLSQDPRFRHPNYWGAFVLYGDWR